MNNIAVSVLRAVLFAAGGAIWSLCCLLVGLIGIMAVAQALVDLPPYSYMRRYGLVQGQLRAAKSTSRVNFWGRRNTQRNVVERSVGCYLAFALVGYLTVSFATTNPIARLPLYRDPAGAWDGVDVIFGVTVGLLVGLGGISYSLNAHLYSGGYQGFLSLARLTWPPGKVPVRNRAYAAINVYSYAMVPFIATVGAPLMFVLYLGSYPYSPPQQGVPSASSTISLQDAAIIVATPMAYAAVAIVIVKWCQSRFITAGALCLIQEVLNPIDGPERGPEVLRLPPDPLAQFRVRLGKANRALRRLARLTQTARSASANPAMASLLMESTLVLDQFLDGRDSLRGELPEGVRQVLESLTLILSGPSESTLYEQLSNQLREMNPSGPDRAKDELRSSRLRLALRELPGTIERSSKVVTSAVVIFVALTLAVLALTDRISVDQLLERLAP